jgi:superfamily II RNA helicase
MPALADLLSSASSPDDTLASFSNWASSTGRPLYPAQEEALLEVFAGSNVILNTPTGSGKSLVALGAHLAALAEGRRSMYTAPIKALVSEKFFSLCEAFGADQVGMVTGDATVNPGAPVLCGTAEILANMALRGGVGTPIDLVVMDEFHFYGDPERGWAWQVPLIEMTGAQWVLMSATLGDVRRFETGLTARTGRPTEVITSVTRPVPLSYEYRRTPIHETIESLLANDQAPVYVVHFTQASAVAQAQALTSLNVATRAQRDAIAAELAGFRFARGFGQTLARLLRFGVGVHHGGMLPKYRRLVERLTQAGLLRVICGTDTLGVGVNLPLRTVVFTGLAKYDGTTTRLLRAREFHQIAGRAGRAGYDASGLVVAQAPEHVIENERAEAKAAQRAVTDGRKARKVVKTKPPDGAIVWTSETFDRLVSAPPEPLTSHFEVSHTMLLEVLDRPGDGCAALRHLLVANDEPRPAQRRHIRRAISMYRSLVSSGALSVLPVPDELGRRVKVTAGLQVDFALNSPLSPFVLAAIPLLTELHSAGGPASGDASPTWALDVVSVVESTLDDPRPILAAQLDRLKTETLGQLKAEGMEYEQRMEVLDKLEYPKPLREWTYDLFDQYRVIHPWAADHNIRPKSVARDLYERAMGFADYVAHYGLMRSEALVLRYLSDTYKGLVRNVPEDAKTEELLDITEWLGELVRQVDSSLIDEWQSLSSASGDALDVATPSALVAAAEVAGLVEVAPPPVTANIRAFRVMVRNAAFRRVELAARRDWAGLAAMEPAGGWDAAAHWSSAFEPYFAEHRDLGTGADARSTQWFGLVEAPTSWRVTQTLDDPAGYHEWALVLDVDLAASDAAGEAAVRTTALAHP